MATWNVNAELLFRGEPWSGHRVRLWLRWPGSFWNSLTHFDEFTDDDGRAIFEIDDEYDKLKDDTPICFTVRLSGQNYDFGPFELGNGAFTINLDPDEDPENVSVKDLTED